MKCFIAVFREQSTGLIMSISAKEDSIFYTERLAQILETENSADYIREQLFMCTDYNLYLKKRLEVKVAELKNYTVYKERYLTEHNYLSEKVFEETKTLFEEQEESLMRHVASRCGQCLRHEIEVTDEIALQCFDLRKKLLI